MQQEPLPFPQQPREYQWEQLFDYFVTAQETQSIVTSVSIQKIWPREPGETLDLDSVRWYMSRYWRWFLRCVNDQKKPYHYEVHSIKNYPRDYFVQAHVEKSRMQYLVHFSRSIEQDKAERKLAVGTGQPRKPRREGMPTQGMLIDLEMEEQPQDELNIQVDTHEREEGPIPDAPEIDVVDEPFTDASEVADPGAPSGLPDPVEVVSAPHVGPSSSDERDEPGPEQVDGPTRGIDDLPPSGGVSQPGPDPHDSPPPPPPRPDPNPWSPRVVVGLAVGVCVVAVVAYFLFFK